MSSRKEDVQKVKQAELNMKKSAEELLIVPLNDILIGLHYQTANKIVRCLEDKSLDFKGAYQCKKDTEKEFLKKQDHVVFFAKECNKKMNSCLGSCRTNVSMPLALCYSSCLETYTNFLKEKMV